MERVTGASRFAGGDQAYLREEQYRDPSRLTIRADLHVRYGTAEVPWFEWVRARLELQEGHRVFEAGCGAGWLWQGSSPPVPAAVELMLCDLSPGMVDEAVGRAREAAVYASVEGRTTDLQSLPFASGSFDRVVANHMLYHLPDPRLGVAELARVVRPDGLVVAATNGRRHVQELHEVEASVLGATSLDHTVDVFGAEVGSTSSAITSPTSVGSATRTSSAAPIPPTSSPTPARARLVRTPPPSSASSSKRRSRGASRLAMA
jgi:SAM-dependent methyltransferase